MTFFFVGGKCVFGETEKISDDALIYAFQSEPRIADRLVSYQVDDYYDEGLSIAILFENCNKIGCSQRFLVTQSYAKEDVYSKMNSVSGIIDVSAEGEITNVALLNLPLISQKPIQLRQAVPAKRARVIAPIRPLKSKAMPKVKIDSIKK